jgi:hypothetical protein
MDPLIENDTYALHWILDEKQTSHFLTAFFSDAKILNQHAFLSTQPDTVVLSYTRFYLVQLQSSRDNSGPSYA